MRKPTTLLTLTALLSLTACGVTLGEKWHNERSPDTMAVVYVYGLDVALGQSVYFERDPKGDIPRADEYILMTDGGYYPYALRPGTLRVWTGGGAGDPTTCLIFDVQANQRYFLRAASEGRQLRLLPPESGESEIATTRRMSSEHRGKSSDTFDPDEKPRCRKVDAFGEAEEKPTE